MIEFDLVTSDGVRVRSGPVLPESLQVYLLDVRPYVESTTTAIVGLDQHGDESFSGVHAAALADAARSLASELEGRAPNELPPLPRFLDDDVAEPEPMTFRHVISFLQELADICDEASRNGLTVRALGE